MFNVYIYIYINGQHFSMLWMEDITSWSVGQLRQAEIYRCELRSFGALGDGQSDNSKAFREAIRSCSRLVDPVGMMIPENPIRDSYMVMPLRYPKIT